MRAKREGFAVVEYFVELGNEGDLVLGGAPVQRRRAMDVDLVAAEPFHAGRDAERPLLREEGGEGCPHLRVAVAMGGEAVVVVGFGEADQRAKVLRTLKRPGEIPFHSAAVVLLEKFRVGPVHATFGEKVVGGGELPAEAFKHEDCVGKNAPHLADDVRPCGCGNHVAGVAAEAVGAFRAPEEEDIGHCVGDLFLRVVEFDEVFPCDPPCAGGEECAILLVLEPLRVARLEGGCPAGMVGGEVEEKARATGVDGVGQLDELVHRRGLGVELGQRRIDVEEVAACEGGAETPHSGVSGGNGVDWQQLDVVEAEAANDVVEATGEFAEGSRRRDCRPPRAVERRRRVIAGGDGAAVVWRELADECGVDGVGAAGVGRGHLHGDIAAMGPVWFAGAPGEEKRLEGKGADGGEGD